MKSTTFYLSAAALASAALAQPHRHHNHARFHKAHVRDAGHKPVAPVVEKRDVVVDWVTEWVTETVTSYYDVTATVTSTESSSTTTTPPAVSTTSSGVAAQFFEPSSKPVEPTAPVAPPPPPAEVKPAPKPVEAPPPPPAPPVEVKPTPAPAPASVAPAPPPPPPVEKPAPPAEKPAPSPAPVSPPATGGGSGSGSGGSGGGSSYTGEVTHYTVGLGACGFDDSGKDRTDYIVALSHNLMTSGTWPDAQCGKKVTLSYGGKSVVAEIRDKCPSCPPGAIDVSEKTFLDLFGDLGIGRARGVSWTIS